jgi:hypothetical protein
MAEDRRWFEKYPNAEGFTRPLTRAEVDELRTAGVIRLFAMKRGEGTARGL